MSFVKFRHSLKTYRFPAKKPEYPEYHKLSSIQSPAKTLETLSLTAFNRHRQNLKSERNSPIV